MNDAILKIRTKINSGNLITLSDGKQYRLARPPGGGRPTTTNWEVEHPVKAWEVEGSELYPIKIHNLETDEVVDATLSSDGTYRGGSVR